VVAAVSADERVTLARRFLAEAQQRSVEQMPPTLLMREAAELRRLLASVLAVLAERQDQARQLAEIRAVLAAFDWEFDDRQLALEEIERIATGDEL
jgi:hypothetical protein